jgi:hypothetical protein
MEFLDSCRWVVRTSEDNSWECEHVDAYGAPMPGTRLDLTTAEDEWPQAELERKRYCIGCPDCGTWWRVWAFGHKAQYYVAPPWGSKPVAARHPEYRQPDQKDICRIIERVKQALPECEVKQYAAYVPSQHDDGIWNFSLPGNKQDIALESSWGMCPFIAETNEWSSYDAREYATVDQAVNGIVEYLGNLKNRAADGEAHAGVVLIDDASIRSNDFGGLVIALLAHWQRYGAEDWRNRVGFLVSTVD